jgi:hypothetical protein
MIIQTASGPVSGSKRSRYMQWLDGWVASEAWSGAQTVNTISSLIGGTWPRTMKDCRLLGYYMGLMFKAGRARKIDE